MKAHTTERIGAAIRKLRLARAWTLAELSDQSGIPLSTLSRVELGQNALNSEKLMRLCRALEVDLEGLVAREAETASAASGRRAVIRAGDGRPVRLGGGGGLVSGDELTDRSLTPVVVDVTATSLEEHGPLMSLASEAYLYVLAGDVVAHSRFYAPLTLATGDGLYFDARSGFAIVATSSGAKVLLVAAGEPVIGG